MTSTDPSRGAMPFAADRPARDIEDALLSRRSVRAFRPDPVPRDTVERILALASRSPSGSNVQPWSVHVLTGAPLDRLVAAMLEQAARAGESGLKAPYEYYPVSWREPWLGRRRKVGWDLYGLLGIGRGDRERMRAQHARNYRFFDAPVALIFTIDRELEIGSWLDYGMFIQSVMLAARAFGLDTCPQAAIAYVHDAVRAELALPAAELVICGMALGRAREDAPENRLVTEREPVAGFARFVGFDSPVRSQEAPLIPTIRITAAQMAPRISRFRDLQPLPVQRGVDVSLEARDVVYARKLMSVIGLESNGDTPINTRAPIVGAGGMTMTLAVCPPGQGPSLHAHRRTYETFTVLDGRFEVRWNDDGSDSVVLERFDTISVPPGVCRAFRNVGDREGILQVLITGGVHDMNDIDFAVAVRERLDALDPTVRPVFENLGFSFNAGPGTASA